MRTICPRCGRETKVFVEKFCLECYRKDIEKKIKIPGKQTIYKCKYCGKYSITKKHLFYTFEEVINHLLSHSSFLKNVELEKNFDVFDNLIKITFLKDNLIVLVKELEIQEKPFTCKFCAMKNSGYKQAIIQLRFEVSDELLKEIESLVYRKNRYDFLSFISKIERKNNGTDLYIGSKNVAYEILNLISKKFPIEYKISKTLVGVKEGKRVYLDTILIRKV